MGCAMCMGSGGSQLITLRLPPPTNILLASHIAPTDNQWAPDQSSYLNGRSIWSLQKWEGGVVNDQEELEMKLKGSLRSFVLEISAEGPLTLEMSKLYPW